MATIDTRPEATRKDVERGVTHLSEVAETIRDDALAWTQNKLGVAERGLELKHLLRRHAVVDRLKYGIAKGVAHAIAAHDERVQGVYLFETEPDPDLRSGAEAEVDPLIHQLILVEAPSAALEAFVASLDRALVDSLRELPTDQFTELGWLLDVKLITEEDIRNNSGYACLVNSTFAPALKIWSRES